MPKKWRLKKVDPDSLAILAKELGVHLSVARLLMNRGVMDAVQARSFLSPSLDQLADPFELKGMDKAVQRVRLAVERGETVMVYGDYDVDGVTATAVASRMLRRLGLAVRTYIPNRMEEGYGLNTDIIPIAKAERVSLIVTVDCGITAFEEADALAVEGIDLVIIDHHEPEGGRLPNALAVIDPKQKDCRYPFPQLAGVGLAAKFAQALTGAFPLEDIDLVTLGTIADVVPLTGENRVIVYAGLPQLAASQKPGIRALIEVSRLSGKEMTPFTVGFGLGPRLNAAGRMGSANTSLDLLLADDWENARSLAQALDVHNRERQRLQGNLVEEALAMIAEDVSYLDDAVLVVHKEGWHKGVLGIASSRITDKFGKPSVVIGIQDGVGVGSARSVEGFRLNEAFAHCAHLLDSFGGHHRAAGVRLQGHQIADFRTQLNHFARTLAPEGIVPVIDVDAQLALPEASLDLVKLVNTLAPYGEGNPVPVFGTRALTVKSRPQSMGKDTLKFWVTDGRASVSVVGFGMATEFSHLRQGQAVDILYTLGIDDWNKPAQVQLILKDLRSF